MKWLILLALVASCGKQTEPAALDYRDSDGDQIQNYKETDFDKYVANFETLRSVKGVIRFNTEKLNEIKFSNEHNLDSSTIELMTGNDSKLQPQEYFSEWSRVILNDKVELSALKQAQYVVQLEFVTGSDKPDEVILVNGKNRIPLGEWKEMMKPTISSNDLTSLLVGNARLVLVKKFKKLKFFDETNLTIKEKTYRVYYHDSEESKIFYVSKELEFTRFLEMMKINKYVPVTEDSFFFKSLELDETNWYTRELSTGDKVIAKTNMAKLRSKFQENYTIQKKVISRVNGTVASAIDLNNKPGAKVYLRIRSISQSVRTFAPNNRTYQVGGGGGGREGNSSPRVTCHSYQTIIANERQSTNGQLDSILDQLNHPEIFDTENYSILSESGPYWELKAISPVENMRLALNNLPESTYVQTGEYRNNCNAEARGQRTNTEGKLSLEVESYVEKID